MYLLCTNNSTYYYCYCDQEKDLPICLLCQLCQFFKDCKIDNIPCDKFLQLNYIKKEKLNLLVDLVLPFYNGIKSQNEDALSFFSEDYYYYFKDIATDDVKTVLLDEIIEKTKIK